MNIDLQTAEDDNIDCPFGSHMQAGIVALILDFPELWAPAERFITPDIFSEFPVKYAIAILKREYEKHGIIPTRELLYDIAAKELTVDDPYEEILDVIKAPSNPRETPIIRQKLHEFIEYNTIGLLYTDEAKAAFYRKDYDVHRKIIETASNINTIGTKGFLFFDQIDEIFSDTATEHISTGFKELDKNINEGGPSTKEVLMILAPTGVGKTLTLINMLYAAAEQGHNALFVTFELSVHKSAIRLASCMSGTAIRKFVRANIDQLPDNDQKEIRSNQLKVRNLIKSNMNKMGKIAMYELPPDECSVNDIYGIIENIRKTEGWTPKVVVLDYLELMMSRYAYNNDKGDYTRQKNVATEMLTLAKNENVLVYSATQTNREGAKNDRGGDKTAAAAHIDLDKAAESFGKAMPVDYVVSLNQTQDEYARGDVSIGAPSTIRLWIAKNRNGPKFVSVTTNVFYDRMKIVEIN